MPAVSTGCCAPACSSRRIAENTARIPHPYRKTDADDFIATANLGDMLDFFDFYLGSYHWPAFNVADSAITIGAILVLLDMIGIGRRHASHPV